jgi:hypothetical protein
VNAAVPVFIMTGHGPDFPGEADVRKNAAVKDVLFKPVLFDQLVKNLESIGVRPRST